MTAPTMLVTMTTADLEAMISRCVSQALASHAPTPAQSTGLLARSALAMALGCSLATVDRMHGEGLPHIIIGRTRRYDLAAVRAWLDSRPLPPKTAPAPTQPASMAGVHRLGARKGGAR